MQASAAATFEGKPVDVDFGPSWGPVLGEGGGGIGSWSGMIYIHRMQNVLSSILAFCGSFSLSLPDQGQYHALQAINPMIKSSPPPLERAFTLIELLIVIATITILATLAVPVFNSVFESAKATKDTSNLRQIGAATQMYMNDNNGVFPVLDERLMDGANKPKNTSRGGQCCSPLSTGALRRKPGIQTRQSVMASTQRFAGNNLPIRLRSPQVL